jgi:hypothetical protein
MAKLVIDWLLTLFWAQVHVIGVSAIHWRFLGSLRDTHHRATGLVMVGTHERFFGYTL